jgi:hypothetical protein
MVQNLWKAGSHSATQAISPKKKKKNFSTIFIRDNHYYSHLQMANHVLLDIDTTKCCNKPTFWKHMLPLSPKAMPWLRLLVTSPSLTFKNLRTMRPIYRTGVPLPSKCYTLYILSTEYFKHAAHSPFFSSKCHLFHNATFFGSCIIHIFTYRVC